MALRKFIIPVTWTVCATMTIEAESLDDAKLEAEDAPLPDNPSYVDGSFEVNDDEMIFALNPGLEKELEKAEQDAAYGPSVEPKMFPQD